MANQLPPTQPAPPAMVALLDQEDIDEMTGHIANLAMVTQKIQAIQSLLASKARELADLNQVVANTNDRITILLAERSERATASIANHCYFDASHGAGECAGPGNCVCTCNACMGAKS